MHRIISITTPLAVALALSLGGCSDSTDRDDAPRPKVSITASTVAPEPESRSCVDLSTAGGNSFVGLLWSPGDVIGVFGTVDRNVPFVNEEKSANLAKTSFSGQPQGMLQYAYFPYSPEAGTDIENLRGNVPATQDATGQLAADYKCGVIENGLPGPDVRFNNILSLVRLDLSVEGSPLESDVLESVGFELTRNGQPVGISGDFTFSATTGAVTPAADAKGSLTATFGGKDARSFLGFVNILPTARKGDEMKITVKTSDRTASFSVKLRVDFRQGYVYNFPLQLASYAGAEYGWTVVEKPAVRGTFTAATYNVDGLPNIAGINSNGPGSAGTTALGQKANSMGWDLLAVSEDFANNDQLVAALTNYSHGTWRGSITIWNSSKLNRADTDGLNFFWNNSTVTSEETKTWIQYQHEAGGLTSGANECIKKGFRYYLVTMKDGTEIDVYITHMNTSGDGGRNEAQNEQITEVVDYILAHDNGRPVIFMGDTNLRWTRHEVKTRLYDRINSLEGWSVQDPWIDFQWNGDYEGVTNHGKSIMAYGPNKDTNDETDDFGPTGQGYGYQKGEVVDKVFYINRTTNATQITATRYLCDTTFVKDNGDPLADHYPVVVGFAYKRTL